ncbi:MAG: 1-acyl-sn-glycerol-3-phosphate acyltransferase [Deltaproteobacteria bacterium]|nr:1-acyl-sn-glycerol-3-phosphate acyltransferase [Deltaproteobacteria bacterium]
MRPEESRSVVEEVVRRVQADTLTACRGARPGALESLINDAVYHENERLRRSRDRSREANAERSFWRGAQHRLQRASEVDLIALLGDITRFHSEEIVGKFDPAVYRFTISTIPWIFTVALNTASPRRMLADLPRLPRIQHNLRIQGELDLVRRMDDLGTILLVPTHSSHLDSVTVGWSAFDVGLPPMTYGAGLNLFTNPVLSFFMHNLGSYRVDRKKKHELYKDVLKTYATVTLERGYDNLFFPGGTRSRNGAIERRLKLGLLGTGLTAFVNNLRRDKPKPNIYVIPCCVSYHLVLEAETLIEDYLKEEGKSRYIIEDDEASSPRKWWKFIRNLWQLHSEIVITYSRPLDPFGNPVDEEGRSLDRRGRTVDPRQFVLRHGDPVHDVQRDAEYTKDLGQAVVESYLRDNTALTTHVLATALLGLLRVRTGQSDVYRLLRLVRPAESFRLREQVYPVVAAVLDGVRRRAAAGRMRAADELARADAEAVTARALSHFATYHQEPVAVRSGADVVVRNKNLVLYYHGRISGYGLDDEAAAAAAAAGGGQS